MKKLFATLLTCAMIISTIVVPTSAAGITVTLNGERLSFDQPPVIINDRTMVPMRGIFEAWGAEINWEQSTQTITAILSDGTLTMQVGAYTAQRQYNAGGNDTYTLDTPAQVINGRTLVPVRFISETLGADVEWDGASNNVIITRKAYVIDTIKTVNMLGDKNCFEFWSRPFYSLNGRDIYYADSNSIVKKFNIDTGEETILLDFNKEIQRLSDEDDPLSDTDNIYMDGGKLLQVFYDKYRNRVILRVEFEKYPDIHHYYAINNNNKMEQIMKQSEDPTHLYLSLPDDKIIGLYYTYDADTGVELSRSGIFEAGNVYYINNKVYYEYNHIGTMVMRVGDLTGNFEYLNNVEGRSCAINGDFIYATQSNGDIKKYNFSGAEKANIKSSDIAVRDGISDIKGQLMFTDAGEMLLFNGTTFRMIKENK